MKYLLPLLTILLFSCGSDDPIGSNSIEGSYIVKSLILQNCNPESNNVNANFSNSMDCVSNVEFEHCRSGRLIISEDNSFTSTINISRRSLILDFTLPLYSINGQGVASSAGQSLNICIDNNCDEFVIEGNSYTHTYQSVGCTNIIILEKE